MLEACRWKARYVVLRGQDVTWSRAQNRKRMIKKMGREDENEDKKMVIPPFGKGL